MEWLAVDGYLIYKIYRNTTINTSMY